MKSRTAIIVISCFLPLPVLATTLVSHDKPSPRGSELRQPITTHNQGFFRAYLIDAGKKLRFDRLKIEDLNGKSASYILKLNKKGQFLSLVGRKPLPDSGSGQLFEQLLKRRYRQLPALAPSEQSFLVQFLKDGSVTVDLIGAPVKGANV